MKRRIYNVAFAILAVLLASPSHAVIIGDKDWLQVTTTRDRSWSAFYYVFDEITGQCLNPAQGCFMSVIGTVGTINVTEYIWADAATVDALITSFTGGSSLTSFVEPNSVSASADALDEFFTVFEPTVLPSDEFRPYSEAITGWVRSFGVTHKRGGYVSAIRHVGEDTNVRDRHLMGQVGDQSTHGLYAGGWLYRPLSSSVPLPATFWLFGSALVGLAMFKRKTA